MADIWRIKYNAIIQPDLQGHFQSSTSQRFVKELANNTKEKLLKKRPNPKKNANAQDNTDKKIK